jgi:hypothetical protein
MGTENEATAALANEMIKHGCTKPDFCMCGKAHTGHPTKNFPFTCGPP